MWKVLSVGVFVVMVALVAVAPPVDAAAVIRFDQPLLDGGTISYDGLGGPVVGTDILFQNAIGEGTPLNSGVELNCAPACLLNFESGANTSEGPVYSWLGGGNFTLTGTLLDPALAVVASGTLLSGAFDSVIALAGLGQLTLAGLGFDEKNLDLAAYYGINVSDFIFANTEIAANASFFANGGFLGSVTEADITNVPVSLPGSFLLIGMGALMLAARRLTA